MGEHTIREVLKRRSSETQRELQKRREQLHSGKRSRVPLLVILALVVLIVAAAVYTSLLVRQVSDRFVADLHSQATQPLQTVNLQSVTAFLPNSLLAMTDPGFFNAGSFSVSPVTSRLVRLYFPEASSLSLHIMVVSLQVRYERTQILEAYINDVPMGQKDGKAVTGIAEASQAYFNKPLAQLDPQNIALLIALIPDPAANDPRQHPERALAARNAVLQADAQQTVLSQTQADALSKLPLGVVP